jgi:hypothetical protein
VFTSAPDFAAEVRSTCSSFPPISVNRLKHSVNTTVSSRLSTSSGNKLSRQCYCVGLISLEFALQAGAQSHLAVASRARALALAHTPAGGSCLRASRMLSLSSSCVGPLPAAPCSFSFLSLSRPASAAPSPSRSLLCTCAGQKGINPVSACVFRHRRPQYHLQPFIILAYLPTPCMPLRMDS